MTFRDMKHGLGWSVYLALLFFMIPQISSALEVPRLKGRVNDYARMLSPATVGQLEAALKELEQTDSTQIVVLTVPSLEGDSLEDFSIRVAEKWKIGTKGLDNGAVLLISKNDRRLRIEVGYGLEGRITDLVAGRIINDVITPRFRSGRFDQGVIDGVQAMIQTVRGEYHGVSDSRPGGQGGPDFGGFLSIAVVFLLVINMLGRVRRAIGALAGALLFPIVSAGFFQLGFIPTLLSIPIGFFAGYIIALFGGPLSFGHGTPFSRGVEAPGSAGMDPAEEDSLRAVSGGFRGGRKLWWRRSFRVLVSDPKRKAMVMRNLAGRFLTEEERERIRSAVKEAEKTTSGEIVPMVVSASHPYPMADVIGGAAISLPLALLITPMIGRWFWIGGQNMWLFLGFFIALFFLFHEVVRHMVSLKRIFVSPRQMEEEVEEAAMASFFKEGLYRTREGTGVLIFISVFERKVSILADRGIDQKAEKGKWGEIVQTIVSGVKEKRQAEAICKAVRHTGDLLKTHFPARADDTDELRYLII